MRSSIKALLAAAVLVTVSGSAFAQNQNSNPQPIFALPDDGGLQPAPSTPVPAAQIPTQPDGGMTTLPTVGNEDPANRMSLSGGDAYVNQLSGAADQRLNGLIGQSANGSGSELEQMMALRRSNMLLGLKREEAIIAVGLWGALFNNEHAQAWRTREDELAKQRLEAEAAAAAAATPTPTAAAAIAAATTQAMPVVYEINNGTAVILVPGGGEVVARKGTVLPNGMEVVSVGSSVVVEQNGRRMALGFGTQSTTIAAPAQQTAPQMATPIALPY